MHGLMILGDKQRKTSQVPLKAVGVDVTVKGFVANVQSTLTYENPADTDVETVFVFPIDDKSAVYHFEAEIDGRHVIAECQDKVQARETYKEALDAGHTTMYLSESDTAGDTFECKLGNLPPHKIATLTFSYILELGVDNDGVVTFTLPTVLNPRYSPAGSDLPKPSSDTTIHYSDIPYKMKFAAKVEGQHTIEKIVSKNETMEVEILENQKSAKITLADESKFKFDHDLTLTVEYEDVFMPTAILEKGSQDKDGFLKSDVVMVDFFPDLRSVTELTDAEFVFIIDCSGSMSGDRIAKARETLLLLLKSLPVGCSFNLVRFGSSFRWLFPSSKTYSKESLEEAIALQKTMAADLGGTEILEPLKSMYGQKPNSFRQVFLLTDGEVSNTNEVISLVKENMATTRIFTFGIGSGASTSLIRNVASATNGLATFVQDNENLQKKVMTVLKCAMQQPVINLNLEWTLPSGCTAINIPRQVPSVFKGQKVIAYALVQGVENITEGGQSSVVLTGDIGEQKEIKHSMTFDLITNTETDDSFPVHRLAAKAQIKDFETSTGDDSKRGEITLVSISANVVSRYTAFVGVDKEKQELVDGGGLTDTYVDSLCYCSRSLCSSGLDETAFESVEFMSYSFGRTSRKVRSGWSGLNLSSCFPFRRKKKKAKSPAPRAMMNETMDQLDMMDEAIDKPDESADDDSSSNLMVLINLQKFDGSWTLDKELIKVFGKNLDVLKSENVLNLEEPVWATALSVACLRKHYMSEKTLWDMIESKALSWLSSQKLAGKSVEEIVSAATNTLTNSVK